MTAQNKVKDKAEELREVTRAANEVLGDLKRERRDVEKLVADKFDELVAAHAERAKQMVSDSLDQFFGNMKRHNDEFQKALENRWGYIEGMCAATPEIVRIIALQVLKDAGGTVETLDRKWHLVAEIPEEDGSSTFGFPPTMASQIKADPAAEKALQQAVAEFRPGIALMPAWKGAQEKGIDDK